MGDINDWFEGQSVSAEHLVPQTSVLDPKLLRGEFALPVFVLKRANLDWQTHRLMIYGKGGPFGSKSKRRVIPLSARIQPLIEGYFALHETFRFSVHAIQRMLKRLANRARISRTVSPHVLRHTFAVTAIQKGISQQAPRRQLPCLPTTT